MCGKFLTKHVTYARLCILGALAGILLLVGAYWMEYEGYAPCMLCLLQRYTFMGLILILSFGLFVRKNFLKRCIGLFSGAFSLVGLVFAMRQIWVEAQPASSHIACIGGLEQQLSQVPLLSQFLQHLQQADACGPSNATFIGLPLMYWTALAFIGYLLLACLLIRIKKGEH